MKKYLGVFVAILAIVAFSQNVQARRLSSDKDPVNYVKDNMDSNKKTAQLLEQLLQETKKTNELLAKLAAAK